ncbi:DNA polymerase/3'-5' exonuclease PolX [Candidatus Azambacteria bacterium]|nr:DNA polymerase/3'-5' exonuclease PolX [Candidatus Azambacteria bacterium]
MAIRRISNSEIARILFEIAAYLDMDEVAFKPRAYERAAEAVDTSAEEVGDLYEREGFTGLKEIPGVGEGIAEKIEELLKTGHLEYYERLKKKIPVDLERLMRVEGVGPKTIKTLYKKLGIRTLEDLEKAARAGKVRGLEHFGAKSEAKIVKGIAFVKGAGARFRLGDVLPLIRKIEERFRNVKEVEKVAAAGSIRRWKETVGDADFLVVSSKPKKVMDFFLSMPEIVHVYARGEAKSLARLSNGMDIDLRVVPKESFGAALHYFTGSKEHNVALRILAQKKGWKLNEYGIFKGRKYLAGRTEAEVYKKLGLLYIPPELRENQGEIEAAREGRLPELVEYGSLRGDLQIQTNWTDGAHSIREMAEEAKKLGLEYIVITDHTRDLAMAKGSDEKKLERQAKEIDEVNKKGKGVKVLKGAEVNIRKDGTLDIADDALAKLDVVGAAVHSNFAMSRADMTKRIIRAIENPHVDILFHPTGRIIQKREPYQVDMEAVLKAAKKTGTVMEIDASPERLDLKDEHIRLGVNIGVRFSIDSDAHSYQSMRLLEFGIGQARRGWAEAADIVNTRALKEFLRLLKH